MAGASEGEERKRIANNFPKVTKTSNHKFKKL